MARFKACLVIASLLAPLMALGCDENSEPEGEATADAAQEVAEAPPTPASAEPQEDTEAEAKLREEAEAAAKEQAAVEANPLTECCRALGQRGFTERNPDYMKASKACGEAMTDKLSSEQALSKIKKELGSSSLPSECG